MKICLSKAPEVHLLFDTYLTNSIKSMDRFFNRGAVSDEAFEITGSEQVQKKGGADLLRNGAFKDALAKFLLKEYRKEHYAPIIDKKVIYVSHGGRCLRLDNNSMGMLRTSEPAEYQANHEEADTLIGYHVYQLHGRMLVRSSDTDVLVILLGLTQKITQYVDIIMDFGAGNDRRFVHVSDIAKNLEASKPGLTEAIVAFHAITGCDFTSCFYRKGKAKPFEYLESSDDFVQALRSMNSLSEVDVQSVTEYVCRLYGFKGISDINKARYQAFLKMTGGEKKTQKVKKINCATLPPCAKVLSKHIQRASYVAFTWSNAHQMDPTMGLSPLNNGWVQLDGQFPVPEWFDGDCLPTTIRPSKNNIEEMIDVDNDTDEDVYNADTDIEDEDTEERVGHARKSQTVRDVEDDKPWSDDSESEDEEDAF